jgi:hypothetical protein
VKTEGAEVDHATKEVGRLAVPNRARDFGGNDRLPNPSTIATDGTVPPRFAAGALVGQRLRVASGAEGVVRRVLGAPITNEEQVVLDGGENGDVAGACAASQ